MRYYLFLTFLLFVSSFSSYLLSVAPSDEDIPWYLNRGRDLRSIQSPTITNRNLLEGEWYNPDLANQNSPLGAVKKVDDAEQNKCICGAPLAAKILIHNQKTILIKSSIIKH